jgi:hypothetical protein
VWQRTAGVFFAVLVLCTTGFFLFYAITHTVNFLRSLDRPLVIAILAGSATILASIITVVTGKIIERKIEIEGHFRQRKFDQSYELLKLISDLTGQQGDKVVVDDDIVRRLTEWHRNLILFAGPKTIRAYVQWFSNLKSGHHTLQTVVLMEKFYKALRSDLGISNWRLRDGELAELILRRGDLFVKALQEKPNMTLAELAAREKMS